MLSKALRGSASSISSRAFRIFESFLQWSARSVLPIVFYLLVFALPLIVLPGWGDSFRTPKLAILFLLLIVAAIGSFQLRARSSIELSVWLYGAILLWAIQFLSLSIAHNLGTALQSLCLLAALLIIPLFIARSDLKSRHFVLIISAASLIVSFFALRAILFRTSLIPNTSLHGSTIGMRNPLSIFLAQLIPIMLLGVSENFRSAGRVRGYLVQGFFVVSLVAVEWVVIANRTRSAWWMLIFYGVSLVILSIHRSPNPFRRAFCIYLTTLILASSLVAFVPNKLRWRSSTPYTESLINMIAPSKSNGRLELWQVARNIIQEHPFSGIGAGQYSPLWRGYIEKSGVDPMVFGASRPELPLFNDFLQFAVELGVFGAAIFVGLFLILPIVICFRVLSQQRSTKKIDFKTVFFLLCCIATLLNALVESPFQRPETVMVYACCLGFIFQVIADNTRTSFQVSESENTIESRSRLFLNATFLGTAATLSALTFWLMLTGFSMRYSWTRSYDVQKLAGALERWPWSASWKTRQLVPFLETNDMPNAERLVAQKRKNWPYDAEGRLMQAKLLEHKGLFAEAFEVYSHTITLVPNGQCYRQGYKHYLMLTRHPQFEDGLLDEFARPAKSELATCRKRFKQVRKRFPFGDDVDPSRL